MNDRLTDIKAREQAATPGPWQEYDDYGPNFYAYLGGSHLRGVGTLNFGDGEDAEADRDFALNARTDVPWLVEQLEQARRIAVELEQSEARLRNLLETLTKAWSREQDHELATAERQNQGENANGAYQRGASLERCGDDIRHLLEQGEMPDWYDADAATFDEEDTDD